jgi:3-oxoacyl-[acyl-carrier protein] reductase
MVQEMSPSRTAEEMPVTSPVVLVTGAVRNTGLAIAEAYAAAGATVVLNGRQPADVAREAGRLRRQYGATVLEAPADIASQEQVDAMFAMIARTCGRLDVLVNNAIIQGVGYSLADTPRALLEEVFQVNVFGTYACSQAAARLMLAQRGGNIVNIGSNTGERAIRDRTAYCASKAAIDGLTRAMALELAPHGIRVNCVVAGYIHTPRWDGITDEQARRRRANIPLGAEATGRDIAEAVLFLASGAASKITGTRLVVDGGALAQLTPADCDG